MRATAIIPIKRYRAAKRRLGEAFESKARADLAAAMLADVLDSVGGSRQIERTIVVTGEKDAERLARDRGAELVVDPGDRGHSTAARLGVQAAAQRGAACVALLPGDCPLVDPEELDRALTAIARKGAVIVPDRHGTGTNALLLAPPGAIVPAFGPGSCERHRRLAGEAGVSARVRRLPSLALDLDTSDDLLRLSAALERDPGRAPATAAALRRLGTSKLTATSRGQSG